MAVSLFLAVALARAQSANASLNLPDDPSVGLQQGASQKPSATASGVSSTPVSPADSSATQKTTPQQPLTAEEQLKQQEKQRILGVMATFNTTQNHQALPLSPAEKFQLFFKSVTDPWPFVLTGFVAAVDQADDSFPQYRQGWKGYGKRYGASYADYFTGNFFGNAVLTSLWHEDPRYYQKGTGSALSRALWAAGSTGWCKRDNGTWGPNYANVMGNLIGASISNVYYPSVDSTVAGTIERGITVTAEGAVGAELIEFWPSIERRYRRKKAEKLARRRNAEAASQGH
ncbi:MAG: hypothetical protein ACRD28_05500 [Acidobacteriaceae bacterium]